LTQPDDATRHGRQRGDGEDGNPYVLIYSRVAVHHNPTSQPVTVDPQPSSGLVPLNSAPDQVGPGATVDHDYVVAEDRFGGTYAWPTAAQLAAAGGYDGHFAHMRAFWNSQLAGITQLTLPDSQLADAWKAGFAYTQIDRSVNALDTGTNGYHAEYEHDVIGILANMFNEGYFAGAHALLDETDRVVGTNGRSARLHAHHTNGMACWLPGEDFGLCPPLCLPG
jgi:hypothetical protein